MPPKKHPSGAPGDRDRPLPHSVIFRASLNILRKKFAIPHLTCRKATLAVRNWHGQADQGARGCADLPERV